MAITRGPNVIYKLAADSKPTASLEQTGIHLQNTDDEQEWVNDGSEWIPREFPIYKKYSVIKIGSNTYILDKNKNVVQGPNSDTSDAVNDQIATMANNTFYEFLWDADAFTIENPMIIPSTAGGTIKKVKMQGQGYLPQRLLTGNATILLPSATFPLNRYVFELNNPGASESKTGLVEIDGFQCSNHANFTREVGFCKLESGYDVNAVADGCIVSNIFTMYLWRTLHLIGKIWFSRFENFSMSSPNPAFIGDTDILLEDGGHVDPATNPTPKQNLIQRLRISRGPCHLNSAIRIQSGGYNIFRDCFIDGYEYGVAPVDMNNTDTLTVTFNQFENLQCLDLQGIPSPDTRIAAVYMNGQCVDNWFTNSRLQGAPQMVTMVGSGVVRNYIELDAWWGTTARITDTGTDGTNVIKVKGGAKFSPATDVAITHTGGMSKVIDERAGASSAGNTFFSGDGTNKVFTIAHGIFKHPAAVSVGMGHASTLGNSFIYTWDTTNITVTFLNAPPNTPPNNVIIRWRAEAYT